MVPVTSDPSIHVPMKSLPHWIGLTYVAKRRPALGKACSVSREHSSSPTEKTTWWRTKASQQTTASACQPGECIIREADPQPQSTLQMMQPWQLSWLQPHENPHIRATQLNCPRIPDLLPLCKIINVHGYQKPLILIHYSTYSFSIYYHVTILYEVEETGMTIYTLQTRVHRLRDNTALLMQAGVGQTTLIILFLFGDILYHGPPLCQCSLRKVIPESPFHALLQSNDSLA